MTVIVRRGYDQPETLPGYRLIGTYTATWPQQWLWYYVPSTDAPWLDGPSS